MGAYALSDPVQTTHQAGLEDGRIASQAAIDVSSLCGRSPNHALLSPELADRLIACGVDKAHRGREKASDHAPVWVALRPA